MRRRRSVSLMVGGGLVVAWSALAPLASAAPPVTAGDPTRGRDLYATGCSSCHGPDAAGTDRGPSLLGVGAASVDFWLSSGRMPYRGSGNEQAVRKPPAYNPQQIADLVAYLTAVDPSGPAVPELDVEGADLVEGGELFRANCAACHGAVAIGGALASGRRAPPLRPATDRQIAEAIRTGPGQMPNFGPDTFTDEQVAAVVKYVRSLHQPDDKGGLGLGHAGPIPEGFVGWLAGLGLLLVAAWWIGERE
ncbi:MAG TPA: c-type cytochrome [Acidimicrobiales bacterium]|nr:c-type cytochrome [Acidimicrobiales bacterium]